jgi:hypothetical protein
MRAGTGDFSWAIRYLKDGGRCAQRGRRRFGLLGGSDE